jgi:hypothetical protein
VSPAKPSLVKNSNPPVQTARNPSGFCFPFGGLGSVDMAEVQKELAGKRVAGDGLADQVDSAESSAGFLTNCFTKLRDRAASSSSNPGGSCCSRM